MTGLRGHEFVSVTAAATKKGGLSHPFYACIDGLIER
ncbi:hypothetical protein EMIT0357P_80254 [Pseudomonas marginalis]